MSEWRIIKGKTPDDKHTEYQVSDGEEGSRTTSYDFLSLKQAQDFCNKLNRDRYRKAIYSDTSEDDYHEYYDNL